MKSASTRANALHVRPSLGLLAAVVALVGLGGPALAQSGSGLTLPPGYDSNLYWSGNGGPFTSITLNAQNSVYVATLDGEIRRLIDGNGDGIAESSVVFYANTPTHLNSVTDILWIGNRLYVSHLGTISTLEDTNQDGVADIVTDIVTNLPYGFHQNNGLLQDGPTHFLICNGSATDIGPETDVRNAAILRCELNGANLSVYASGLRNTFRIARHPVTGDIFGGDNEWNGHPTLALAGDEVNRIVPGATYGYPAFFGDPPPGSPTAAPTIVLPPRVAPTGLAFNPGLKISGYRNEIYMALFTNNVATLARIPIWYGPVTGYAGGTYEAFATGFTNPIDVKFLPDGAMLVADFSARKIHRIFPRHDATITIDAPPIIGTTCPIRMHSPTHPSGTVVMAASGSSTPSLPLGAGLDLYLDVNSPIFLFSVTPGNGIFNFPAPGTLDANGDGVGTIAIPNAPALVGLHIWISYAVATPALVPLEIAPAQSMIFLPSF